MANNPMPSSGCEGNLHEGKETECPFEVYGFDGKPLALIEQSFSVESSMYLVATNQCRALSLHRSVVIKYSNLRNGGLLRYNSCLKGSGDEQKDSGVSSAADDVQVFRDTTYHSRFQEPPSTLVHFVVRFPCIVCRDEGYVSSKGI